MPPSPSSSSTRYGPTVAPGASAPSRLSFTPSTLSARHRSVNAGGGGERLEGARVDARRLADHRAGAGLRLGTGGQDRQRLERRRDRPLGAAELAGRLDVGE